ncbi:MAG: PilW family protein [Legionella sp.]
MSYFLSRGLALSELLISLFISSLLMSTMIGCYISHKRQYVQIKQQLEAHFELSLVKELLTHSIRRAGFTPCLNINYLDSYDRRTNSREIRALSLNRKDAILAVNRMNEVFDELLTTSTAQQLIISSHHRLKENHPMIIADCTHAEIHQVTRVVQLKNSQIISLARPLLFDYDESAAVGAWLEERWFIKSNHTQGNRLYYQQLQTEELTSLVHSLELKEQQIGERLLIDVSLGTSQQEAARFSVAVRGL